MLRLLTSKAQGHKDFWKSSKPYHVGIHWIALTEYSQMSTHMPWFQSFFSVFASFCIGKINHHQHKGLKVKDDKIQIFHPLHAESSSFIASGSSHVRETQKGYTVYDRCHRSMALRANKQVGSQRDTVNDRRGNDTHQDVWQELSEHTHHFLFTEISYLEDHLVISPIFIILYISSEILLFIWWEKAVQKIYL